MKSIDGATGAASSPVATAQSTESPSQAPALAVVPEPTPDLLAERNRLLAEVERLTQRNADLAQTEKDLRAHIAGLEENPLFFALNRLDSGAVYQEAGEKLAALCEIVEKRDAKGTFKLTLTAKPFAGGSVVLAADISTAEPKLEPKRAVMFTKDGKLQAEDPRQAQLPLGHSRGDRSGPGEDYRDEEPEDEFGGDPRRSRRRRP